MGVSSSASEATTSPTVAKATLYDFEAPDIDGKLIKLSKFKDKAVLVVNVASK